MGLGVGGLSGQAPRRLGHSGREQVVLASRLA